MRFITGMSTLNPHKIWLVLSLALMGLFANADLLAQQVTPVVSGASSHYHRSYYYPSQTRPSGWSSSPFYTRATMRAAAVTPGASSGVQTRQEAEEALRRFEELQGVRRSEGTIPAISVTSSRPGGEQLDPAEVETASADSGRQESLPPPKSY